VFVDDATSRLMELRFVASESTFAYFEALKAYLVYAGSASGALLEAPVRLPQRRFDTQSRAIAACVVDFKRQKNDQRAPKG
jgi:hypothetical protein